ncbi:putative acetyltransferase EpsM [Shewanella sp. P1-14-1]|uniref:acetyltransferase n=1 Tax=Shewanella sp. P1-14-1 TaxID=1723761 RepID=UPI0006D68C7E|nr:acetyltransferase [Shewanella sp. P1-14-1]KPZ69387.1 putative acetyltransferase EpsM [Shewanella sp. P1-14-1]
MSKSDLKSLIVIGGGGHASVLVDILRSQQRQILAVVSPEDIHLRHVFHGLTHLRNDHDVLQFNPDEVMLVNGVGMLPGSKLRRQLSEYYLLLGYQFETVVSLSAHVSNYASIEVGAQVFPGAIVQAGVKVASQSIINSGAIIEHDSNIGMYSHVAPNATLCGQVTVGEEVFIGAGATIIQNITLANNTIIGAGATVTNNLNINETCYPNRSIIKHAK